MGEYVTLDVEDDDEDDDDDDDEDAEADEEGAGPADGDGAFGVALVFGPGTAPWAAIPEIISSKSG